MHKSFCSVTCILYADHLFHCYLFSIRLYTCCLYLCVFSYYLLCAFLFPNENVILAGAVAFLWFFINTYCVVLDTREALGKSMEEDHFEEIKEIFHKERNRFHWGIVPGTKHWGNRITQIRVVIGMNRENFIYQNCLFQNLA